ncbi:MAG: SURF1 family protein [Proteobacteria bacterium]|nr:SURF1 family protein [Pseudomonadota bacterium]
MRWQNVGRHYRLLIVVFACVVVLVRLGFWQLSRAEEKRVRSESFSARLSEDPLPLAELHDANFDSIQWRRATGHGRFTGAVILLDNRTDHGQIGTEVLSPFQFASGFTVIVNRGWIRTSLDRRTLPKITTVTTPLPISGHIGPPPVTGLKLNSAADDVEDLAANLMRIQSVDLTTLGNRLNLKLAPFVVYLDAQSKEGFERSWPEPGDGAAKHRAYAVQWFAMAFVLMVITIVLIIQRNKGTESRNGIS